MFTPHGYGFGQGLAPHLETLARNGKHQIKIQIIETGLAQNSERSENHFPAVNPPKFFQQLRVERLDAHRNPVNAVAPKQPGLIERDSRRIAFHGPFTRAEQIQPPHGFQNLLPLTEVEQRRSAAAKKDSSWP